MKWVWINCFVIAIVLHLFSYTTSFSQADTSNITINGKVYDTQTPALAVPVLMIVNLTTGRGIFGNENGSFVLNINKKDTLLISAIGYSIKKICFADSVFQNSYQINIPIEKLKRELEEVEIFPQRDLKAIESDIEQLGYDESKYRLTGIDAWSAPLTALYQEFSKKEKDKRRAAQLWNDEKRRDLLKELLRLYDKNDLINLPAQKQDSFIEYLDITDNMMKTWTQYELAVYIKAKYAKYTR